MVTRICTLVVLSQYVILPPHLSAHLPHIHLPPMSPLPFLPLTAPHTVLSPPAPTTDSIPALPSIDPPPHTAPGSSAFQYIAQMCSVYKLFMFIPPPIRYTSLTPPGGGGEYQPPSGILRGCLSVSRRDNLWWNPPRVLPMWGVTTHVSNLKRGNDCMTALNKFPEVREFPPHPPSIREICVHLFLLVPVYNIVSLYFNIILSTLSVFFIW